LTESAIQKRVDLVSGYKHKDLPPNHESMSVADLRTGGYTMDPGQWLMRILFLETIAGVPGFTATMIRHLRSLRIMRRDGGWIHMLLEEAENERNRLNTTLPVLFDGD
jgi:ubiquinol oxidase